MNVAFHILTVGIPLGIYHIYSCFFSNKSSEQNSPSIQTSAINSATEAKKHNANSTLIRKAEKNMQEEIASKITEEYPKILNTITVNLNNPLSIMMIKSHKESLALAIHTIWTNHNLRLLEEEQEGISKEKMYEVLNIFAKECPLLNDVKDLIAAT